MYKKKKLLALCLAGLCSTTTISTIYSASALAATTGTSETSASTAASTTGGNPPAKPDGDSSGNPPAKPSDDSSSNPQNGNGNPPAGKGAAPENTTNSQGNSSSGDHNPPSGTGANAGGGNSAQGNPPDGNGNPPSGENGQPGNPPDGNGNPPSGENGQPGNPPEGQPGGPNTQSYDYTGTLSGKLSADGEELNSDGETIATSTSDENAALAENGGTLKITNGTLEKSGDDTNGDNCNFYGINSILLSVGENSTAYISNSALSADSEGSNGIFATNQGTVFSEKNSITTTKGNSRGLDATYGGTIIANDMTIQTSGDHSASLATDRGGGNISVTNSTLHTNGSGSPLLYSTGAIEVSGVTGTAEGSQIAGMEGLNHILIYDSDLSSTITDRTASDPVANGVIIYQSTSGDADTSTGERAQFQAVNSALHSKIESGAMFYVTNTNASILLSGTTLDFDSTKAKLLQIEGNDANNWGHAGSNGAQVTFTGRDETLTGDISVDSISSLDLYLLDGTTYTGQIQSVANADSQNTDTTAPITVNLDATSTWVVTGDTTLFALNAEDGAKIVDESGKTVTIVADGNTVVKGDSEVTITVTGTYSDTVETSDVNSITDATIDRTNFDEYYGTTTAFSTSDTSASVKSDSPTDTSEETTETTELVPSTETETATDTQTAQSATPWILAGVALVLIFAGVTTFKKKKE